MVCRWVQLLSEGKSKNRFWGSPSNDSQEIVETVHPHSAAVLKVLQQEELDQDVAIFIDSDWVTTAMVTWVLISVAHNFCTGD